MANGTVAGGGSAASRQDPMRLPPQNVEAEESLLSAVLLDNTVLLDLLEILRPEDFYRRAHQLIFAAMGELFSRSEPIDLITLTEHLKRQGHLEKIGGAAFVARLLDTVPVAPNAPYYGRIVRDKACLRHLIDKANAILKRCFEDHDEVAEVLDFAEGAIYEISEDKVRPAFTHIGRIIEDNIDTLEERQGNKALVTGVGTGFQELDTLTAGLQPSDLVILAARPSMGKTALALNIARNAAVEANVPTAVFSLEMSKEQLSMRLLSAEARVDSSRLRGGFLSSKDWNALTNAAGILSEAPIYIDDSPDVTAISIRAKSRRLKMDQGIGLVIVDYLQLMRASVASDRRDLEISEISRSLKALAKELELPVLALSQLNRKLEERADKRPQLADLRESGALEQDADVVAFIYRDEVYNKDENNPNRGTAEIILAKQRNGPTGRVKLAFLNAYTRFENLAPVGQG